MYHKCVNCGKLYERAAEEILTGCVCGGKLFYFVKNGDSDSKKKKNVEKNTEDMEYFYELEDDDNKEIIIFDIEAINIKSSGKYELNLDGLMNTNNSNGLVYKYGEGKYSIDLDNNLKQLKKGK
jgi:predicted  nucleic acid-binding Zn-ribbon protein